MSAGEIREGEWAFELTTVAPSPARNPVGVYLSRLAPGSRRAMRQALGILASLAGVAEAERFPWQLLRYPHTQALRARVAERYAPASANKVLCALRGVGDMPLPRSLKKNAGGAVAINMPLLWSLALADACRNWSPNRLKLAR